MRRRLLIALGVLVALLTFGIAGAVTASRLMPALTPESTTNPIALKGCVIRFDTLNAGGTAVVPRIYEDSFHHCVGVTAVSLEANGDLRISNTGGVNEIVTVWAVPDESLAADSLTCGVSGGGTVNIVRCYKPNGVRINFGSIADVYGAGNNIWYGGMVWDD